MDLATAYPNSAISAGAMLVIALVMTGSLALWLALVFLADRKSARLSAPRAWHPAAVAGPGLAGPDETAEDEQDEAGPGDTGARRQAAA